MAFAPSLFAYRESTLGISDCVRIRCPRRRGHMGVSVGVCMRNTGRGEEWWSPRRRMCAQHGTLQGWPTSCDAYVCAQGVEAADELTLDQEVFRDSPSKPPTERDAPGRAIVSVDATTRHRGILWDEPPTPSTKRAIPGRTTETTDGTGRAQGVFRTEPSGPSTKRDVPGRNVDHVDETSRTSGCGCVATARYSMISARMYSSSRNNTLTAVYMAR